MNDIDENVLDTENTDDTGIDLLTLVDEEGGEHQLEVVDSAEVDGQEYFAMVPFFENAEELLEDTGELIIMKVVTEDDDEFLEAIEDEEEFNKIGDFFMDRLSDVFDFEEEPGAEQ